MVIFVEFVLCVWLVYWFKVEWLLVLFGMLVLLLVLVDL